MLPCPQWYEHSVIRDSTKFCSGGPHQGAVESAIRQPWRRGFLQEARPCDAWGGSRLPVRLSGQAPPADGHRMLEAPITHGGVSCLPTCNSAVPDEAMDVIRETCIHDDNPRVRDRPQDHQRRPDMWSVSTPGVVLLRAPQQSQEHEACAGWNMPLIATKAATLSVCGRVVDTPTQVT